MAKIYDNKYKFIEELGHGGFGRVFKAKERISNRFVAIKELKDADQKKQEHIIHELKTISKFQRERIVAYFTHFFEENRLFIVMEYCPNGNLREHLRVKNIPVQAVNNIIKAVAKEFHFIHSKGVIHRDIKPDNLLISDTNQVKIADFGIANKIGGTRAYMSPESLSYDRKYFNDPRADIYALGVTMLELLTGKNPFIYRSKDQILKLHEKGEFSIHKLPEWQQEIILKAIHKEPELRFQSMNKFADAISAKHTPFVLNAEILKAGEIAVRAESLLGKKKWIKAIGLLEHGEQKYPNSLKIAKLKADYYLRTNKIELARTYYEKAFLLNSRINIQKELGSIYLEEKEYPQAITMLSEHLYKEPADLEAYNLLLKCYYETGRYESGMDLAEMILQEHSDHPCFINNHLICNIMQGKGRDITRNNFNYNDHNPFVHYNLDLFTEKKLSHNFFKKPTIKSKLLFMDFRFEDFNTGELHFVDLDGADTVVGLESYYILSIGRKGYTQNKIQVSNSTSISRRHCVIINQKDDYWLIDLGSTVTYLNSERIDGKAQLIGVNEIKVGDTTIQVTTDKKKLI